MITRNKKLTATMCVAPFLLAAGAAHADLYSGGAGFAIPDNNPAGGSSTISAVNLLNPTIFSFDSVTISVSVAHTWVGDVTVTLTAPDGTSVQLFRRPGTGGVGNSGDWLIGNYTFVQSGGSAVPNAGNFAPGTYNQTSNPGSTQIIPAPNPNTFANFNGLNLNGTWTLNISDGAAGDTGSIGSWSMNITSGQIPEPSTFALLGMMAAGALGVRVWRKRTAA